MRGTTSNISNLVILLQSIDSSSVFELLDANKAALTAAAAAALLAHSNAISVLPVPLLYIIEPRIPVDIQVSAA